MNYIITIFLFFSVLSLKSKEEQCSNLKDCNLTELVEIMDKVYTYEEKEILKKIGSEEYGKLNRHYIYDKENKEIIRNFTGERISEIEDELDSLLWIPLISCENCNVYWEDVVGTFEFYSWKEDFPIQEIVRTEFHYSLLNLKSNVDSLIHIYKQNIRIQDSTDKFNSTAEYINGIYIPNDLNDAIIALDSFLDDDYKQKINSYKTVDDLAFNEKFRLGTRISRRWELWGSSRIAIFFKENGINLYKKMSLIILVAYYYDLNNKPVNIYEIIKVVNDL